MGKTTPYFPIFLGNHWSILAEIAFKSIQEELANQVEILRAAAKVLK